VTFACRDLLDARRVGRDPEQVIAAADARLLSLERIKESTTEFHLPKPL